ncbi:uncharacterized protein LOC110859501 [Folsomia candida]|uniref:uncharacterized protein LOC110859501 n=1 Tax=Folsomia candida TaxID=158441 RepID=UPI001604E9B5|nr:uncharacterized protein LOC110859501 [Folsomia candida]
MNTSEYNSKIQNLLDDQNYNIVEKDPTTALQKEIHTLSKGLKKLKRLSESEFRHISHSNCKIPRFYGLPKVHKANIPLRPIVDFRNSPSYNLAHHLNKILKCMTIKFPTNLKNSYEFAHKIKDFIVPANYEFVSFDVVSLFTKVPIQQTLAYIKKRLEKSTEWKTTTSLTSDEIMKLLKITVKSNYFTWKGEIYKQTDGSPMGSPISPIIAEFCLQELEEKVVLDHPDIAFFKRFVDDGFACIRIGSKEQILQALNNFHPCIQFTCESEVNMKIPFLDVLVTRDNMGIVHRQVYRKPTHTGRYLNYHSYHHPSQKIAVIDALAYRALSICDDEFLEDELKFITDSLTKNGYPRSLINMRLSRMKDKFTNQLQSQNQDPEDQSPRIILPYMGPVTHRITAFLQKKLKCKFGYLTGKKMKQILCSYKENPPPDKIGIYRIRCSCPSDYIGETGRPLHLRTREHLNDIRKKNIKSALALHMLEKPNHQINQDSADFLKFLSASLQQQQQNSQDSVPALYQDEPVYKHPQFWRDVTPFGKIQIRQFWDPLDFAYYAIIRKINRNEKIGNLPDSLIRIPVKDIADVVSRMRELFTEIDSTNVRDEIPSLKGNPYAAIEDRNDDNF